MTDGGDDYPRNTWMYVGNLEAHQARVRALMGFPEPGPLRICEIPLPRHWRRLARPVLVVAMRPWDAEPEVTIQPARAYPLEVFDLPGEVAPRLIDLDHADVEQVRGFVLEFGQLAGVFFREALQGDWNAEEVTSAELPGEYVTTSMSFSEPLDDFQAAAAAIKALALLKQELSRGVEFSLSALSLAWPFGSPWPCPQTRSDARQLFSNELRRGLLYLSLTLIGDRDSDSDPMSLGLTLRPSLYARCVLEILNSVLADRPYRRCANETCRRTFSIQEGPAPVKAHRTDLVRFCSPACARAQASRDYRRRKRQERGK
jgi:hypothetical protein